MGRVAGVVAALLLLAAPLPVRAVQPDEVLSDPALETRARKISGGLRCLVCQNQSIDDSDAPLARDLRILVRERLKTGDSDEAVGNYIVGRYGEFVLLKPVFRARTALLWLMPALILAAGAVGLALALRRRAPGLGADPLSAEETARIETLLAAEDEKLTKSSSS